MSLKHKNQIKRSPQWWAHLREWKRIFWKAERQAQKRDIKQRIKES